jgi:hypothetical protein
MIPIVQKVSSSVLVALLVPALIGCSPPTTEDFAIYLVAGGLPATEISNYELDEIELQSEPVLSVDDVLSYTAESHEMQLTREAYERIQGLYTLPVEVRGMPFVVAVGEERIYGGAFWTPLSSLIYEGVIICQPFDADHTVITLSLGYPSPEAFRGQDPRSDPRILNALEAAGKLE